MHHAKAWMPTTNAVPIQISEKKKTGKKLRDKTEYEFYIQIYRFMIDTFDHRSF